MKLFKNENKGIKIKICGLAREEDIIECSKLNIHALGFLLGNSKDTKPTDKLSKEEAKYLISTIPSNITSVLLLKENSYDSLCFLIDYIMPDAVQLQNKNITPTTVKNLSQNFPDTEWIKTINIKPTDNYQSSIKRIKPYINYIDAILIDSMKGGSGKSIDWDLGKQLCDFLKKENIPMILAGGLNSNNIAEAANTVKPFMVDMMSSVSLYRGKKNIVEINILTEILNS